MRKRDSARSCFVLVTPEVFRENRSSRLYGWLYDGCKKDRQLLGHHLPHRNNGTDWISVSERVGWLTFEECNEIAPGSCAWLTAEAANIS